MATGDGDQVPKSSNLSPSPAFHPRDISVSRAGASTPNGRSSVHAPSVQFDEQNLLASPSSQRERLPSLSTHDASSPIPASGFTLGPSLMDGSRSAAAHRRDGSAVSTGGAKGRRESQTSQGVRSIHSLRPMSRASEGGSSGSSTKHLNKRGTASYSRKRGRQTVNTMPSWARDDTPSPPTSPPLAPVGQASQSTGVPRSTSEADSMAALSPVTSNSKSRPTDSSAATRRDQAGAEAVSTWPASIGTATPSVSAEPEEMGGADTPERWWTFTLPQKYRTRLHEHHLKMALHDRQQSNAGETAERKAAKRRSTDDKTRAKPKKKRSVSESDHDSDAGTDDGSQQDEQDNRRGRYAEGGIGGPAMEGAAAGLGASGLLDWTRGRGRTRSATAVPRQETWASNEKGGQDGSTDVDRDRDLEKQGGSSGEEETVEYPTMSFKARIEHPDVYTVHQPATPGWASPWKPEERVGGNSIEIGGYRFRANGTGYFARTDTKGSRQLTGWAKKRAEWLDMWTKFLIHNPFVPLLFRFINICFTAATLAVAIKLFQELHAQDATDAVGSSPIVAIIYAPLTLVHVGLQIWLEYSGRPIGLWTVTSKLAYTTIELIFICLWSAELGLAFDNYFTSTLVCVSFGSPYQGVKTPTGDRPDPLIDMSLKPYLCRLQGALIGLVFVSLLAYVVVMIVSLFRIFVRVTGGRR